MLDETQSGVAAAVPAEPTIRPGGCGGCTLCCKVMAVPALAKPAGTWCRHCRTGSGCGIYESRPNECAEFLCGYLAQPELPEEWKPVVSRLILSSKIIHGTINVFVDPGRPDAWRKQPYYGAMQQWARRALATQGRVVVHLGARSIVILPDHAVDLGVVADDELIVVLSTSAEPGRDATHHVYAAKQAAWKTAGSEIAQTLRVPPAAEGFRVGRRLD
jgi:hypothetical protein